MSFQNVLTYTRDCDVLTQCSLKGRPIVTQIAQAGKWYPGEDYHQEYRECPVV